MFRFTVLLLLAAPAVAQTDPRIRAGIEGTLQIDYRLFAQGPEGDAPGFLVRRARAEVTAELDGRLRAVGEVDAGEGDVALTDGYLEADVGRGLHVRVGRFKTPFGAESLRSSSALRFAERALPTALAPRRDVGAMLWGAWSRAEVQLGLFNGVPDGSSRQTASDGSPDVAARVAATPVHGLRLGLAATAGRERGTPDAPALAGYETSGGRSIFAMPEGVAADGPRLRVGPEATLDVGRLSLLGEWTRSRHAVTGGRIEAKAWQVAASVVLVGDARRGGRPAPVRAVTAGGPGAVEVSARLSALHVDGLGAPGSVQRARSAAVAVQWSLTDEARIAVTAERTAFGDAPETLVIVRSQIAF